MIQTNNTGDGKRLYDGSGTSPNEPFQEVEIDREEYERDLKERQEKHLKQVRYSRDKFWRPCMHDACTECLGTGFKSTGGPCIHMLACNCPKCSPCSLA